MRRILFILFIIILLVSIYSKRQDRLSPPQADYSPTVPTPPSATSPSLTPGEYQRRSPQQNRSYLLYVPDNHTDSWPLVLFFHGGGGDMNQAKTYEMQTKAMAEGFVLAILNGASRFPAGRLATWNAGTCCGYARDTNSPDVNFVQDVIADIQSILPINPKAIFATGMSNGGLMSYRLACEMSDTFAAIAAVAGTDNTTTCQPNQKVAILHIHALDDTHVLFNGGAGPDSFRDVGQVAEFTSVPNTIDKWVSLNRLNPTPNRIFSVPGAYCDEYQGPDAPPVKLCVTEVGGHSWTGNSRQTLSGATPSKAFSANDMIWDFFSQNYR